MFRVMEAAVALVQDDGTDCRAADVWRCSPSFSFFSFPKPGPNAVAALVNLALTNSSPFTPFHSGLYAYTALLIIYADRFKFFNPCS